jgi:hypothetical protein
MFRDGKRLTAVHQLPVIKHRLRERLTGRSSTELTVEAKGLHDGQVSLDGEHGGTGTLLLAEDLTTALVKHRIDTTDSVLGTLDFDEVDGLLQTGCSEQAGGIANTTASRDDLSSTTVNSIGVQLQNVLAYSEALVRTQTLTVTSRTLKRTPRMFSSQQTPSLVAHWKAATQESLISFKY